MKHLSLQKECNRNRKANFQLPKFNASFKRRSINFFFNKLKYFWKLIWKVDPCLRLQICAEDLHIIVSASWNDPVHSAPVTTHHLVGVALQVKQGRLATPGMKDQRVMQTIVQDLPTLYPTFWQCYREIQMQNDAHSPQTRQLQSPNQRVTWTWPGTKRWINMT